MLAVMEPADVCRELAGRVRKRRLQLNWSQAELADRAGIAFSTLKLFEQTGQISLERLVMIASALRSMDSFEALLQPPKASSLAEIEARVSGRQRSGRKPK
jgi:transcriptional regulator with XRE-family HTH domain